MDKVGVTGDGAEFTNVKGINWGTPSILLLGVFLVGQVIRMTAQAPSAVLPAVLAYLPLMFVFFTFMAVAAWLRRRKSSRTWDLMLHADPDAAHFITFVYPAVKTRLRKFGWRIHGSSYASVPAVGVSISRTAVTFWEYGVAGPTLTLDAAHFESATVGRVSDGYRGHPAIELRLNTKERRNRLRLNLRDARHRNISAAQLDEVRDRFPMMSTPSNSNQAEG